LHKQIEIWLDECVDHGRFLTERSADRKDLQSLVSYWSSLLRQHGYEVFNVGRLAPFGPIAGVCLEVVSPYPGLNAYDEQLQEYFYGRDQDAVDCFTRLVNNHILLIIGVPAPVSPRWPWRECYLN